MRECAIVTSVDKSSVPLAGQRSTVAGGGGGALLARVWRFLLAMFVRLVAVHLEHLLLVLLASALAASAYVAQRWLLRPLVRPPL